ncbi:hypothetical protein DVDV_3447 [Desulfovibrio sp. DV]|nr:hypothetical protein DVDV_3447 [Desulfovibrio sp. DV]
MVMGGSFGARSKQPTGAALYRSRERALTQGSGAGRGKS